MLGGFGSGIPQPTIPKGTGDVTLGPTIDDLGDAAARYWQAANDKYNLLMSMSKADLDAAGYFITTDNGSVFKGTMDSGVSFLPLQDIQQIENERGTPGQLLMHFNEPALAKDTAGYEGGSSSTTTNDPPAVPPIPTVQTLPPVIPNPDGSGVVFDPNEPAPMDNTDLTGTGGLSQQGMTAMGGKYWWLWFVAAAIIIFVYLKYRK
jgi:hypothetical protein